MSSDFIMPLCFKRYIDAMNQFGNPSKKPRLEVPDWDHNPVPNEDLWGQAELTAEEFDFLEVQATQNVQVDINCEQYEANDSSLHAFPKPLPKNEEEEVKKQQYALEGQVKLLTDSLEKTIRELSEERHDRQKIIEEKTEEFKNKELHMQKEMERIQTVLQFKDQEMQASHSKVQLLEHKLKEQLKDDSHAFQQPHSAVYRSNQNAFLSRFKFAKADVSTREATVQTIEEHYGSSHILSLISPEGELKGSDVVSRLLINKKESDALKFYNSNQSFGSNSNSVANSPLQSTLSSIARLNADSEANELWQHYEMFLRQHIIFLQSSAHGKSLTTLMKVKPPESRTTNFLGRKPATALEAEIENQHSIAISCLEDLSELFLWQCPTESLPFLSRERNEQSIRLLADLESAAACSIPLFTDDERMDISNHPPPCLTPLLSLANADTYPDWYYHKRDQLEHALKALTTLSFKSPTYLESCIHGLPLQAFVAGQHGIKCAGLAVQLLANMLPLKCLGPLIHQMGSCLYTSIAELCHVISKTKGDDYIQLIILQVEKLLCDAIAVLGVNAIDNDNCLCSAQLVQGFVTVLWTHCETYYISHSLLHQNVLKKGIITLHQLAMHITNFRNKRLPVEDQYITLLSSISKISKENAHFKFLLDTIHDLCDFQDDAGDESEERTSDQGSSII